MSNKDIDNILNIILSRADEHDKLAQQANWDNLPATAQYYQGMATGERNIYIILQSMAR
jgi:hypothetical protein